MLWMLIVGVCIGALARWMMPGEDPMNIFQTCLLGIVGSLLGGFVGEVISYATGISFPGIITSIGCCILILWCLRNRPWEKWSI